MGCISLPSILNAIIGIISYYVILKMVMLHDATKTIRIFASCNKNKNKTLYHAIKTKQLNKKTKPKVALFFD